MPSWDQANREGKLSLVWRNRTKISQNYQRLPLLTVLSLNYSMMAGFFLPGLRVREPHLGCPGSVQAELSQTREERPRNRYSLFCFRYSVFSICSSFPGDSKYNCNAQSIG
jgi:hypothetical protein